MSKRLWGAALALGMGWTAASAPIGTAKPPDLPVHPQVTCPEGRVTDFTPPAATPNVPSEPIPDLSWVEAVVPGLAVHTAQAVGFWPRGSVDSVPAKLDRQQIVERFRQAQRIYLLGMQYQQQGAVSKARTCFQEAHLLSPDTRFGRMAMERLHELESRSALTGAEEAEEQLKPAQSEGRSSEQSYQEMLRRTIPLGTVPVDSH
jgi:hypothetical protein